MARTDLNPQGARDYIGALCAPLDALADPLPILPITTTSQRTISVRPPGSKSMTNRAIMLAALAKGTTTLTNALTDADDAQRMMTAIRTLGARTKTTDTSVSVSGVDRVWTVGPQGAELDLANAGTATRFLSAAAMFSKWPITITGDARMRQRPIGGLIDALEQLGARVTFLGEPFCPPIRITSPAPLPSAPTIKLGSLVSSQFISALLLIGPFLPGGITIQLSESPPSEPYIRMTLSMLEKLGVPTRASADLRVLRVSECELADLHFDIEPDASGASYFLGAGALLAGSTVRVEGLNANSLQGDIACADMLASMGATKGTAAYTAIQCPSILIGIDVDCADVPDIAMTIAAVACFAKGPTTLRGLGTLRVKETDRIHALCTELRKINVRTEELGTARDALRITPPNAGIDCSAGAPSVVFDTYNDHRMAMSLALIGLRRPNTVIRDPACVKKTYPTFWRDFAKLYS